jgi:hypothetical protein
MLLAVLPVAFFGKTARLSSATLSMVCFPCSMVEHLRR